jgi:DNA-binding NtrC family response regulator
MRVLFLDDDADLRAVFAITTAGLGHDCLTLDSYQSLIALGDDVHRFALAVIDINLGAGKPSGLDAFKWLRQRSFAGSIVFLTGHGRSHPLVKQASLIGTARVLQKPISVEQLSTLLVERPLRDSAGESVR